MKVPKPRKLSSGMWFIQLRLNGTSIPITASTAKECTRQAELIKANHRADKKIKALTNAHRTLGAAIDDYIALRENTLSESTIRGYKMIRKHRFQALMNKELSALPNLQKAVNAEALECAPKTLRNAWMLIVSVLKENGIEPPVVSLPQVVSRETKWLEPEQIPVFIKAVNGKKCEIPALLALCSLRRSEIYGLTWDNIDLDKKLIRVSGAKVIGDNNAIVEKKTNKNQTSRRTVPIMIPELFDALNLVEDKTGPIVTGHPNKLYDQINAVCRSADLPLVGVHGLRHSFASLAYHLNVPEKIAMQIGGWSNYDTMRKIYTHLAQSDIEKYAKQLTDFYAKT